MVNYYFSHLLFSVVYSHVHLCRSNHIPYKKIIKYSQVEREVYIYLPILVLYESVYFHRNHTKWIESLVLFV